MSPESRFAWLWQGPMFPVLLFWLKPFPCFCQNNTWGSFALPCKDTFKIYFYYFKTWLGVCERGYVHLSAGARGVWKRLSISWSCNYRQLWTALWGCWELNSSFCKSCAPNHWVISLSLPFLICKIFCVTQRPFNGIKVNSQNLPVMWLLPSCGWGW